MVKPAKGPDLLDAVSHMIHDASALANLEQAVRATPHLPQPAPIRPLHILLAEDNVVNQRVGLRMLERLGHIVTVAGDGRRR